MALKVHTCAEAASGPKNVFGHILQTFATKITFLSLTVVLIPKSTHPMLYSISLSFSGIISYLLYLPIMLPVWVVVSLIAGTAIL
jgi:hypothetical protein